MHIRTLAFALAALFAATASAATGPDIDKVNGAIRLDNGQLAGDLQTVNGSIHLADNAKADEVSTVNGSIELGASTEAASLETVNGEITVGDRAQVRQGVEAVNGAITIERGATIGGGISNVNGRIGIESAHVGGGLSTVQGDIEIGAGSRVDGGILVERPSGISWGRNRNPRIVIGPEATVVGKLVFKRDVDLYVSTSAKIGAVEGATAKPFDGATP
ncbi:MAG TPA: hypothetical protein VJ724_08540 [Tahibacter sp.]|nr:hypothetical protein [Tahibacter sp.]